MMRPSPRHPGFKIADLPPTPISRGRYGVSPKRQSFRKAVWQECGLPLVLAAAAVAILVWGLVQMARP